MNVTGDNKKVAEAIFAGIQGAKDLKPMDEVTTLEGYDLTFVGFPVRRFEPPDAAKAFLEN